MLNVSKFIFVLIYHTSIAPLNNSVHMIMSVSTSVKLFKAYTIKGSQSILIVHVYFVTEHLAKMFIKLPRIMLSCMSCVYFEKENIVFGDLELLSQCKVAGCRQPGQWPQY